MRVLFRSNLLRLSGICLAGFGFSIAAQAASPVNTTTFYHLDADGREARYSFRDLQRLSNRCANVLEAQGIEQGDRVAILLAQGVETAIAHLATYKLGAIAVPLFTL